MAASLAKIEIDGGISGLRCPITGIPVITEGEGFNPDAAQSPHLRFFVDWVANVWVADPSDLTAEHANYQSKVVEILANNSDEDDQNTLVSRCIKVLPSSVVVFEIRNPPSGSFDGEICYACFDLDEPASDQRIQLKECGQK